jgi:hypothetical protein
MEEGGSQSDSFQLQQDHQQMRVTELHRRISVLLSNKSRKFKQQAQIRLRHFCILDLERETTPFSTASCCISLKEIYDFDSIMNNIGIRNREKPLLLCFGPEPSQQVRTLKLIGCHLVMSHETGFEAACLAFRPFTDLLKSECHGTASFENLIRALCCVKCLKWVNFSSSVSDNELGTILMDEYVHYARYGHKNMIAQSKCKKLTIMPQQSKRVTSQCRPG